ncbi:RDD family protein [Streptomyces sp. NPDC060194]|uniref:RDD family protein n=1 Tax=Streptomyces sp. NPDC060194 TaxID=3347069 RepID=UPI003668BE4D
MDNREAIGSWLSGPGEALKSMGADVGYRGERLGLPETGPGAIAPLGRRFGAILLDWGLCLLIAYGLLADGDQTSTSNWTLLVFLILGILTVGTIGATPGKWLFRIRVIGLDGRRLPFGWAVVRTALLCLGLPPLIWDRDGRGLHDRLGRAVQIRI